MSFALRTTFTRVPRAIVQIRGYADKTMTEQAGDMLKKVGQAFKVSRFRSSRHRPLARDFWSGSYFAEDVG